MKSWKIFKPDYWLGYDKLIHLLGCIALAFFFGCTTAIIIAFTKEVGDGFNKGFSYKDMFANLIGVFLGVLIRGIIHL